MEKTTKNVVRDVAEGITAGMIAAEAGGNFDFTRTMAVNPMMGVTAEFVQKSRRADLDRMTEKLMKKAAEIEAKAQVEAEMEVE